MCNCPSTQVTRAGFLWREFIHKGECTSPSADTLMGFYLGSQKGETQYPQVKTWIDR